MVMDAQISPQTVGLEFVRQYYTLLNQAPTYLHKFYNRNSSFVHDGLESVTKEIDPVVGQEKIHERILELNFRDCHAKITQVDSQYTLGNGVVVQVSGELSNAGEPMRRFTQTFVLAAENPKRYYVHNDIFRYQDVFGDDEIEADSGRTDEDDPQEEQERTTAGEVSPPQTQTTPAGYYNVGTGLAVNGSSHHDEVQVTPSAPQAPQGIPPQMMQSPLYPTAIDIHHLPQPQVPPQQPPPQLQATPQPPPQLQPPQQQQVAGVGNVEQSINSGQTGLVSNVPQEVYQQSEHEEDEAGEEIVPISSEDHVEEEIDKQIDDSNYPSLDQDNDVVAHETVPVANEPQTYANLLKSGTGGSSSNANASLNVSPQGPAKSPSSPPPGSRLDTRNNFNLGGGRNQVAGRGGPRGGATVRGMNRGNDRSGQQRPSPSDDGNNFGDIDKRRSGGQQQHPDTHQVFVGKLPLEVTENELRGLFGKYGTILDLRILQKPNIKGQTASKQSNYGFIVFDNVTSVQTVLRNVPFYYPATNGIKLNVEEKKTRPRGSSDGRIGSGGDVRGSGGPRMGPGGGSLRVGRGGFGQGRGMFQHGGRGGMPTAHRGGPSFHQRNSIPR